MKPILITGANGFIGSHIVEHLLSSGFSVRCLLRPQSQLNWLSSLPVDLVRVNYSDAQELSRAVEGCSTILHFGGATKAPDAETYHRANVETTRLLLQAAKQACPDLSNFVLCSSQAALGPSPSIEPLTEEALPQPLSVYGQSKLEAETVCRDFADQFPITILRPPAVYGPRDKDILIFFRLIKWGLSPAIGRGERYVSLVNALDIARLIKLILEVQPQGFRIYHVTDGEIHTWSEISGFIAKALHRHPLKLTVPNVVATSISKTLSMFSTAAGRVSTLNREKLREIMQSYWLMSSAKAVKELGYHPEYDLEKGVELTARWYRGNHWL
ncbi:MAG: NAD(P)-dependent oxidoreductase [bacterium]|nr:NAD(P)-dependent oxidoreductase [bacterium]